MAFSIRRVDYFYVSVRDRPGEGFQVLSHLAELGVNLLAFNAVPMGPNHTQLTLFPEENAKMEYAATRAGMRTDGPIPLCSSRATTSWELWPRCTESSLRPM